MNEQLTGMNYWQVLNALRQPDGRLIYSRQRDMYYLSPAARWVPKPDVTGLLAERLVEQAGETPGVYRLSARGMTRWCEMPPDVTVEGACDGCGHAALLRPNSDWNGCLFICAACRAREEDHVIEATYQTPVV